jgi:ADP-ribose pyrophosphatase YjhB (NUDIX family)
MVSNTWTTLLYSSIQVTVPVGSGIFMPTPPRHSVSVAGAIIDEDGRMLAIRRRDNGHWEPPGGVLELTETIEAGLVREIREETGITVMSERLTGVYKNMEQGIVALVFRCSVIDRAATRTDEVEQRMDEAYAVRLLDAVLSTPPAIRAHNGVTLRRGS